MNATICESFANHALESREEGTWNISDYSA